LSALSDIAASGRRYSPGCHSSHSEWSASAPLVPSTGASTSQFGSGLRSRVRLAADSGRVMASARSTDPEVSGRSTGCVTRSSTFGPVCGAWTSNGDSPDRAAPWTNGAAMVAAASVPITVAREMRRCPAGRDDVVRAGRLMGSAVTTWSNDVLRGAATGRVA
jgi:hypothetical protein